MNSPTSHVSITGKAGIATDACPLLAISEHKRSGLILCKPYRAEFAGPGAAVGTLVDQGCTAIIAIGSPEIIEIQTHEERQQAYGRRIQWIRWLQKLQIIRIQCKGQKNCFLGLRHFWQTNPDESTRRSACIVGRRFTSNNRYRPFPVSPFAENKRV